MKIDMTNTKYIIKRPERTDSASWHAIEGTLMVYGNLTRYEGREYVWEKTSDRKTSEIVKGLDIEIRLFKKSDEEIYGVSKDERPITVKSGVTGCMNCNVLDCKNGSKYEQFPDTNSDACKNRVFAGDDELYAYIASQY